MPSRILVLVANILIRAVLGNKVRDLLITKALDCPIWTEDKDFFGSGFPTWTTNKIHIFFEMS